MQNRAATEPPRVLLTGAGSIARRHAQNIRLLEPQAQIQMVCNGEESQRWAGGFGTNVVPSVEAGLQARPQIAVVCSVSAQHAQDLELLAPEVEALYIEKPMVTDAQGLDFVRTLLNAGWDKPTVVGCNLRYLGAIGKLKGALDAGEAGQLASARLQVGQWLPDWRGERDYRSSYSAHRSQGGGVIFDLVHELDSACFLFGEIARGQASAGRNSSLEIDSDDAAAVALLMKSGLPVQVGLDYVSRQPVREYTVVGDRATLRLDLQARELHRIDANQTHSLPTEPVDWDMGGTYRLAMEDLLAAWSTGSSTRYDLRQAMHTTEWMVALEASAWRIAVPERGPR